MLSASESCWLISSARQAIKLKVKATIGVAVRRLMDPNHFGARPSSTKIRARRDGTINVGFNEVVIAMIAPRVTSAVAPHGKYFIATSVIGVGLDWI